MQTYEGTFRALYTRCSLARPTPGQTHQAHPLLSAREYQQLTQWNNTCASYPQNRCLPELVTQQAQATPEAVALVMGEQRLTYSEMNRCANSLAHYLRTLGIRPGMLVGCCIERSPSLVIALLAILKVGAAYVPLDPSNPAERLAFMLQDSRVPVLLTLQKQLAYLPTFGGQSITIDNDPALLTAQDEDLVPAALPADLAYVIYTSGSTGYPKGVEITHASMLNLLYWHQHAFAVSYADRATQFASPGFDAIGWELWPYLALGASVYFPDEETRTSPLLVRDWLLRHEITISFLPTPLAESVIELDWPPTTALRYLLTGADTLHRYPPASLPFAFINNYGPTEATVVATSGHVFPCASSDQAPTIGRPIANTQIYILDEYLRQVPIGTPGELYIGGAGLARGYLNRPDLTAEKFIPHPFSDELGALLYRTGDQARYLPDGQIAFSGRLDNQAKIRGFRIEMAEIEVALQQHPAVQQTVVTAREDETGNKYLIAYVVTRQLMPLAEDRRSALSASFSAFLGTRLPDYMIPDTFVFLSALPLTTNGKIDRAALPVPEKTAQAEANNTPAISVAERLVAIIAPLLGLQSIDLDDNFFLLGGHSLLATQLIMRVAAVFGVHLSLRTLFHAPSIRQLAAEIEGLMADGNASRTVLPSSKAM